MDKTTVQEDIATFAERFEPGTIKLFIGISGAGKSTLAFRVADEVSKQKRVVVINNESHVERIQRNRRMDREHYERVRRRWPKGKHENPDAGRTIEYIYADPYTVPEGLDLATTDLLVMGQAHRELTEEQFAAMRAHLQEHPQLAILMWGTMPRWAIHIFERMEPDAWHERLHKVALAMDAFAIVKPETGWHFRKGQGPQQVHFLTPERTIVEVAAPTRRLPV